MNRNNTTYHPSSSLPCGKDLNQYVFSPSAMDEKADQGTEGRTPQKSLLVGRKKAILMALLPMACAMLLMVSFIVPWWGIEGDMVFHLEGDDDTHPFPEVQPDRVEADVTVTATLDEATMDGEYTLRFLGRNVTTQVSE